MYNRPYTIDSGNDLLILTRQADFYCALPIVSATLSAALIEGKLFKELDWSKKTENDRDFEEGCFFMIMERLLYMGLKLRHRLLFRECFIHIVGLWQHHKNKSAKIMRDPVVRLLVEKAHAELNTKILKVFQSALFIALKDPQKLPKQEKEVLSGDFGSPEQTAQFWRLALIRATVRTDWDESDFPKRPIKILLASNLVFDRTGFGAGEGIYERVFLCADIADEDMPWEDAVDW